MPMATLSRWSMSYFAAGLALLLVALGLMAGGWGYPASGLGEPATLIVVHLVVIGWLSLVMAGALQQFVPVLVTRPLAVPFLALPALALLIGGLATLIIGFAGLAGLVDAPLELMPAGGLILSCGAGLLVVMLAATILGASPLGINAGFVLVGLASLILTVASGTSFAGLLAGFSGLPGADALLPAGLGLHVLLGLGGWLGVTAFGVGYRLYPMFMLTPETSAARMGAVLMLAAAALVPAVAAFVLLLAGSDVTAAALPLGASGLALATLLHGRDILALYQNRRRKQLEINMLASLAAFGALAIGMALLPPALLFGAGEPVIAGLVFLLVFGWLSGLTLSQLVKIVAFMTWIEVFAPRIGRSPTPRVGELARQTRLLPSFVLYFVGVAGGSLALAFTEATIFRAAMALCLAGCLGIGAELVCVRRLAAIGLARRPEGGSRLRLFLPSPAQRRPSHADIRVAPARDR